MIYSFVFFLVFVATVSGKFYLKEDFNDAGWSSRWTVPSDWKPKVSLFDPVCEAQTLP